MARSAIVLVGVVHGDPLGEDRLFRLLERLSPAAATLEVSSFSIAFRNRHGARLSALADRRLAAAGLHHERASLDWLFRFLEPPFEWKAADRWSAESGREVVALGDRREAAAHLDVVEDELLAAENLARLCSVTGATEEAGNAPTFSRVERERRRAELALARPDTHVFRGDTHVLRIRDGAIGEAIRKRASEAPGTIVHVAGWEHLVLRPDLPNVAWHLSDLRPERRLLWREP